MDSLLLLSPETIDRSLLPNTAQARPSRAALELALETGLVEPVVVRNAGNKAFPRYQLLSGDAALEIANRVVLPKIPAFVIGRISDEDARAFVRAHEGAPCDSRVERKLAVMDLFRIVSAIEQAKKLRSRRAERCSYASLAREYGITPIFLSHLRRIREGLHKECFIDLLDGRLTLGHAKALARFPRNEQPRVATRIIRNGYSVRQVERSARKRLGEQDDDVNRGAFHRDADIVRAEQEITHRFGWRTHISFDKEKQNGSITFYFDTLDGYEYLLENLGIEPRIDAL